MSPQHTWNDSFDQNHFPTEERYLLPRQLGRRPLPRHAGRPRGPRLDHGVGAVALGNDHYHHYHHYHRHYHHLEHDLPPILDLADVGPVLIQPHVADQQDLAVFNEAREGTVN